MCVRVLFYWLETNEFAFFNVEKQLNLTEKTRWLVFCFCFVSFDVVIDDDQTESKCFQLRWPGGIEKKWHNLSSSRSCERARTTERSRLARLGSRPPNQPQDTHSAPLLCSAARKCSSLRFHPSRPTTVVQYSIQGRGGQRGGEGKKKRIKKVRKKKKNKKIWRYKYTHAPPTCRLGGTQQTKRKKTRTSNACFKLRAQLVDCQQQQQPKYQGRKEESGGVGDPSLSYHPTRGWVPISTRCL